MLPGRLPVSRCSSLRVRITRQGRPELFAHLRGEPAFGVAAELCAESAADILAVELDLVRPQLELAGQVLRKPMLLCVEP